VTSHVGTALLATYELTMHCKVFKEVLLCYRPPPIISTTIDGEQRSYTCELGHEKELKRSLGGTNTTLSGSNTESGHGVEKQKSSSLAQQQQQEQQQAGRSISVLLIFCSYVFQDLVDHHTCQYARICFLILTSLTEDPRVNNILHDPSLVCHAQLFRKATKDPSYLHQPGKQTLAAHLLDLLLEFMKTNMKKKLEVDMYRYVFLFSLLLISFSCYLLCYLVFVLFSSKCFGIIHRLLSYETRQSVRLDYKWSNLWDMMFRLAKFLISDDSINRDNATLNLYRQVSAFIPLSLYPFCDILWVRGCSCFLLFVYFVLRFLLSPNSDFRHLQSFHHLRGQLFSSGTY
jgi:hypothetical protein